MPNIYESHEHYYIKEGERYRLYDVLLKRTTIVLMPTDIYADDLDEPTVYTYQELRNKLIIRA